MIMFSVIMLIMITLLIACLIDKSADELSVYQLIDKEKTTTKTIG